MHGEGDCCLLLVDRLIEEENLDLTIHVYLLTIGWDCNRESLDKALHDPSAQAITKRCVAYEQKVRTGHL